MKRKIMKRKIFDRFKYAEEFCHELTNKRISWQMTVTYDVKHFDEGYDEPYIYDDFIVDYVEVK